MNAYLSLGNIWLFYEANYLGMILFAVLLVVISTLIVYLSYRNKEETIKECEKK